MIRGTAAGTTPHTGYASGDYLLPPAVATFTDRTLSTSAQVFGFPFVFPRRCEIDLLRIYLTTAQTGAEMMAGIYSNLNGYPSARMVDLGALTMASGGAADKDWAISDLSVADWVWVLIWNKNVATGVTVKGPSVAGNGHMKAHSAALSGAFTTPYLVLTAAYPASMPATAPASMVGGATTNVPIPMLRIN